MNYFYLFAHLKHLLLSLENESNLIAYVRNIPSFLVDIKLLNSSYKMAIVF